MKQVLGFLFLAGGLFLGMFLMNGLNFALGFMAVVVLLLFGVFLLVRD